MRALLMAALALCGCGGSDAEPNKQVCDPGKVEACACVGAGESGAQTCSADGSKWGACDCPGGGSAGGPAGGASSEGGAAGVSGGSTGGSSSAGSGDAGGATSTAGGPSADCYLANAHSVEAACVDRGLDTYNSGVGAECPAPCKSAAYGLPPDVWCCPKMD